MLSKLICVCIFFYIIVNHVMLSYFFLLTVWNYKNLEKLLENLETALKNE